MDHNVFICPSDRLTQRATPHHIAEWISHAWFTEIFNPSRSIPVHLSHMHCYLIWNCTHLHRLSVIISSARAAEVINFSSIPRRTEVHTWHRSPKRDKIHITTCITCFVTTPSQSNGLGSIQLRLVIRVQSARSYGTDRQNFPSVSRDIFSTCCRVFI